jgi:hypothetical protein
MMSLEESETNPDPAEEDDDDDNDDRPEDERPEQRGRDVERPGNGERLSAVVGKPMTMVG